MRDGLAMAERGLVQCKPDRHERIALIVMCLFVSNSTSVNSVMDSQGNQFILIGSQNWSASNYFE